MTIAPKAIPARVEGRSSFVRRPLTAYFAIALGGTWLAVLPLLLGADGIGLFGYRFGDAGVLFAILGTFTGPLLAALTVTSVTEGRAGVRKLLDRVRRWRVSAGWYLVALFGFLGIWLAGYSVWLSGAPLRALAEQQWQDSEPGAGEGDGEGGDERVRAEQPRA